MNQPRPCTLDRCAVQLYYCSNDDHPAVTVALSVASRQQPQVHQQHRMFCVQRRSMLSSCELWFDWGPGTVQHKTNSVQEALVRHRPRYPLVMTLVDQRYVCCLLQP
jgi:hypothetical protein